MERPRFGLSPAQASALASLRSNGQRDVQGCLRLFVAVSNAESCKGPTIQQMRLWGWGPGSARPDQSRRSLRCDWTRPASRREMLQGARGPSRRLLALPNPQKTKELRTASTHESRRTGASSQKPKPATSP